MGKLQNNFKQSEQHRNVMADLPVDQCEATFEQFFGYVLLSKRTIIVLHRPHDASILIFGKTFNIDFLVEEFAHRK